ncbi:uncharacterized protein LOC135701886 [Ochlerotatus camptorhynchus]|uniref:uncharacterized protein LOC135701886 n=1 Tax=Ochlerotatus camptorhynchus TaxID=644619 RepID=UPI0031D33518
MWRILLAHPDTDHEEETEEEEIKEEEIKEEKKTSMTTPKKTKEEKMAELKSLISKRGAVKSKLSRTHAAVQAAQAEPLAMSMPQVRVHSRNVDKYYGEYNEVHDIIMQSIAENQRENHEDKLIEFEELNNEVQVFIETLMEAHAQNANRNRAVLPAGVQQNGQPQVVIHQQALRAPLPTFDGRYENWPKFKSMFQDLMRNSPDSDAVKLFHLDKSLVGSAAGILDAKTIQDNNYQQAWQILEQRYENKRLIIDVHVQGIMQLKKMAKKSSKELRSLIDECSRHVENLKFHEQHLLGVSEIIIVHILSGALDQETRELWEGTIDHGDLPKYAETMEFLRKRCLVLERCESTAPSVPFIKQAATKAPPSKASKISAAATVSSEIVCELCGGDHPNFKCSTFRSMSVAQRLVKVKKARVCFNCLPCFTRISQKPKDNPEELPAVKTDVAGRIDPDPHEGRSSVSVTTSCLGGGLSQSAKQVMLQTAVIDVEDVHGRLHPCRALLDSGSQAHILSESMAQLLALPTLKCNITVVGANAVKTQAKKGLNLNFSSRYCSLQGNITCLISERPTGNVPSVTIDVSLWNLPQGLQLADPEFLKPHEIDLVLASNYVWDLLRTKKVVLSNGTTSLRETDLGWIVTGTYDPYQQVSGSILIANVALQDPLAEKLEKFWSVEEVTESSPFNTEEQEVEQHFLENYRRDESGRFVVQMPLRETVAELDDNRNLALKRFYALERKLSRNPELRSQYCEFMREYESLGHCNEIREEDDVSGLPRYYVPHHAVFKLASSSTKLRVVFDASAKSSKYSLNDVMKTGPTVQNDIFSVDLRFRRHTFGFSGDVTKMYRQVGLDRIHTRFLRIFWREDPSKPLRVLELITVTYGTAAAPFLATRSLVQLAVEEQHRYPVASKMVKEDVYVDDMLSGANTEEEAAQRLLEVKQLLSAGGFPIRKWSSNSTVVLESVPEEEREKLVKIGENGMKEGIKALGILWDTKNDQFTYENWPEEATNRSLTKRHVLAEISKLYDPLGLVSPVIVCAKIIMQKLWSSKMNWDDELEEDILVEWVNFRNSLTTLNLIQVPRCVMMSGAIRYEIHGFADASIVAYGACIYMRSVLADGSAELRLMCAKSRVAPLKAITIPRLELLAALLLARLMVKVIEVMEIDYSEVTLWSDSQITLAWLKKSLGTMETFVRNRVAEINRLTNRYKWKYVNTKHNPADVVSRGQAPAMLCKNNLWWSGPEFLKEEEYCSPQPAPIRELEIPELKVTAIVAEKIEALSVFARFSSFRKLQTGNCVCPALCSKLQKQIDEAPRKLIKICDSS